MQLLFLQVEWKAIIISSGILQHVSEEPWLMEEQDLHIMGNCIELPL